MCINFIVFLSNKIFAGIVLDKSDLFYICNHFVKYDNLKTVACP